MRATQESALAIPSSPSRKGAGISRAPSLRGPSGERLVATPLFQRAPSIALAVLLVASGVGHRLVVDVIETRHGTFCPLAAPLASLPLDLGPWRGREVALDERILGEEGFDDFHINRLYMNTLDGRSVSMFIGYTGRAHRWMTHRPDICYPAHGRQLASEDRVNITTLGGHRIPCILYEFRSPKPIEANTLVLSTFIINGRYSNDKHSRNAKLLEDQPPYIARVQVGVVCSGDRDAAVAGLRGVMEKATGSLSGIMPYMTR